MPTAKISSKGQITIPIEVRNELGLKEGDQIEFYALEDGKYAFRPKTGSMRDLPGILQKMGYSALGYAPSVAEMDEAILDDAAELDDAPSAMKREFSRFGRPHDGAGYQYSRAVHRAG